MTVVLSGRGAEAIAGKGRLPPLLGDDVDQTREQAGYQADYDQDETKHPNIGLVSYLVHKKFIQKVVQLRLQYSPQVGVTFCLFIFKKRSDPGTRLDF